MEFYIVGSTEANSLQNKISNESPVGRALIGKVVGDCVDVETGRGISSIRCWKSEGFINLTQRS